MAQGSGWFRRVRKKDKITIDGPAVIIVESGRPSLRIRTERPQNIGHVKHKKFLTPKPGGK